MKQDIIKNLYEKTINLLEESPDGLTFSELKAKLNSPPNDFKSGTIHSNVYNIDSKYPNEIYKPARGLYKHIKFRSDSSTSTNKKDFVENSKLNEDKFYEPFKEYIINELSECNSAAVLGGKTFKDKWKTPDVIGFWRSVPGDIISTPTEIISAEIKVNSDYNSLITSFGQACSYKIFSHKVYIVIPKTISKEDYQRLESLCMILGIGLILFDKNDFEDPKFEIKVRATKTEPDFWYVNHYLPNINKELLIKLL